MEVLVIGGTGTTGSEVVRGLLRRGIGTRVLVRSPEKAAKLPEGARAVAGDLRQEASLDAAFRGADAVFLLNALSQDETAQGLAAVNAARRNGIAHVVYMSVHRLREAAHIPHFATKIPVEDALRDAGLAWTFLQPNNFFQNDFWFAEAITRYGVYPQPIGSAGTSRVDVRDIADAAVNALAKPEFGGQAWPLVGPDILTGEQVAAIYTRHLGREVCYAGDDLDAFAAQAGRMLPEWLVQDLRVMYGYFQKHGLKATPEELERCAMVVGHPPRSFDAWVAEAVPSWKAMAAGQ